MCGNSVYRPIKPQAFFCKTIFIVTGVTSGERTVFDGVLVARPLVYCLVSSRSLFFLLSFIFLSLCCLSSFEFTDSDFPCAIFKLFFYVHIYRLSCLTVIFFKVHVIQWHMQWSVNPLFRYQYAFSIAKQPCVEHIVLSHVLDSYQFSIIMRVRVLT